MIKKHKLILVGILLLSLFLRIYKYKSYYVFSHDQDLASWVVKDVVVNHHLRLIGQETSSQGIFIGALFYYLQIPFYLIAQMSPLGAVFLPIILGVFATYSIFFVFSKLSNVNIGLIGAFIYASSALIVFIDREVAPTMPVMLWTVWYLYSLFLIYKNSYLKGLSLSAFLIGLIWHLNLALIILTPLVFFAFLFSYNKISEKKINLKAIVLALGVFIVTISPFLIFEARHGFSQSKSIYLSLTTSKDQKIEKTKFEKVDRVMQLVNKNTIGIFSKSNFVRPSIVTFSLLFSLIYFFKVKKVNKFIFTILFCWVGLYIVFFSLNPLNPSEYYFNGMNIVWIFIASLIFHEISKIKSGIVFLLILALLFLYTNIHFILNYNNDKKGYIERVALVSEIKSDSLKHGYPCVSVSYITSPGYDLGYRYLFYLLSMHVNKPISNSPVYTIVYPHGLVDKIDKPFGSLGLIYPDYDHYNVTDIEKSCKGTNANLTEPMFGFTE